MASTKLQSHHSLPAPVLTVPQSKSHVLAGVQDAYWSDEEEDQECPLCLEEMDISDLNFKPCVCGYQICRFCWHHIKENLNKRCPACRRIYTDEGIEFKPVATQDHKRLTQQKKQRDREKKELETLGRRHLANVRVVQRNVVYVVGIGPRFAKEELIPTLRSNEYFGQYGKISKILIVKRTSPGGTGPAIGLYITYIRREDAARAIAAVDGAPSPGGGREIMRASYGTTKYCMAFLRNVTCNDHNCMNLHEWGDEKDCFTKEDLTTLKHTMKATESRAKAAIATKKEGEDVTLPRAASWGQKSNMAVPSAGNHAPATSSLVRQTRRSAAPRQARGTTTPSQAVAELKLSHARTDRKPSVAINSQLATSRPSTPGVTSTSAHPAPPVSQPTEKSNPPKELILLVRETNYSPVPSLATASDAGSAPQESAAPILPSRPTSTDSVPSPAPIPLQNTPQVPAVPPGLSAPPGIPSLSRPPRHASESPQTPLLASQSSYQMSVAARALLDDVKARRETFVPSTVISPFPEFDRTLQTLSGDGGGGFSFNLDPKLADEVETTDILPELEMETNTPFHGSYIEAFPALRTTHLVAPPGLGYPRSSSRSIFDSIPNRGLGPSPAPGEKLSNYMGSFNPFSDVPEGSAASSPNPSSPLLPGDEERKVSRFGFARGRQSVSVASSPLNGTSHIALAEANGVHALADEHPPSGISQLRWNSQTHEYGNSQPPSMIGSPLIPSQLPYIPQTRFQPFDSDLSEAQLREFIQVSRDREFQNTVIDDHGVYKSSQQFSDPAIMSASFGPPSREIGYSSMAYGPPPGLGMVPSGDQSLNPHPSGIPGLSDSNPAVTPSTSSPALSLSAIDFPALVSAMPKDDQSPTKASASLLPNKNQDKSTRKTKKVATTERAGEHTKLNFEKFIAPKLKAAQGRMDKDLKGDSSLKGTPNVSVPGSPLLTRDVGPKPQPIQPVPSKPKIELKWSRDQENTHKEDKSFRKEEKTALKEKPAATKPGKRAEHAHPVSATQKQPKRSTKVQAISSTLALESQPEAQVPILSKKPKKSKPVSKLPKVLKEDDLGHDAHRSVQSADHSGASHLSSELRSPSKSPDRRSRLSAEELLEEISRLHPGMDLASHPFFDLQKLSSTAKMPLEYGPLVHALSALSVGGGSFANNVPSGSIDTAVSSFQQLLETLTQTISDLLRLLPRTTWDDSSSFDGVLRDMLKGDDFLDEGGEDGHGKDDEVAALTLALERRARWMEVQLSKLEELHRDINTAAVKAVLTFNDNGWDRHGFLPRLGNSLRRFENIALTQEENGDLRPMTADELEKKLSVAREVAIFAEAEAREAMSKLQVGKQFDSDFY